MATSGFGPLQIHVPQSGQTHRVTVRPLSTLRWRGHGTAPTRLTASVSVTSAIENALADTGDKVDPDPTKSGGSALLGRRQKLTALTRSPVEDVCCLRPTYIL
jgi:hypothetical protein